MKRNFMILAFSLALLLLGCSEKSQSSADTPEDALQLMLVENDERETHVYGSHQVNG
ncbi:MULTISPECIES: hypothetical protein [Sporosarcina]|uniref:hypothetical protein n=1 Tax=Sporosarcina TaxID=1569 RepID=UPI00129B8E66|nr:MULTISPECIES: hypothetical protein [Sporosarcina]GKV64492.1 hypothetical protein NCCP2331_06450 [Sporosarcina sp. NCCP-2331]GLB57524.1 hypothetical protein NCCP2378_33130 [Sporosarcina sp. NCCP-2378]